jgi:diacylglycerol kinase family enzyme
MARLELALNLHRVYRGTHLSHPKVTVRRARRVFVGTRERVCIEADGEVVGFLPAEFNIVPGTLSVIY